METEDMGEEAIKVFVDRVTKIVLYYECDEAYGSVDTARVGNK